MISYFVTYPQLENWPYKIRKIRESTGTLLSAMYFKDIGTKQDLLKAHYYAVRANKHVNMPNAEISNSLSKDIIKSINKLS